MQSAVRGDARSSPKSNAAEWLVDKRNGKVYALPTDIVPVQELQERPMEQHDYGRFRVRSFCIYERSVNRHDYLLATRTDTELFTENGGPRDRPFEGSLAAWLAAKCHRGFLHMDRWSEQTW